MKIKNLFLSAMAFVGLLAACTPNNNAVEGVTVDPSEVTLDKAGDTKDVTINTTDSWTLSLSEGLAEWLTISDKSGTGAAKISLKAEANTGNDRNGTITVKAGYYSAKIKVSQPGDAGEKVESQIEKLLAMEVPYSGGKTTPIVGAVNLSDVWWVAKYDKTGIVTDGTAFITVFSKETTIVGAIGEKGTLTGDLDNHSYRNQVTNPVFTKTGTVEVNHGNPLEMKDQIDSYDWQNSKIIYVHVVGTARETEDGKYINIFLDGCNKDVSFASSTVDGKQYKDKQIEFYGYFVSGTNHISVMPVGEITVKGEAAPDYKLSVSAKQTADGFQASWNEVEGADSYYWEIYKGSVDGEAIGEDETDETSIDINADENLKEYIVAGNTYIVVVTAYSGETELVSAQDSFTARDMSAGGEEVTLTLDADELAALACKDAENKLDDVITLKNSSDYGTNAVTELRIYKNGVLAISANGASIVSIEFTCTAKDTAKQGPGCWGAGAPEGYTFSGNNGTWTGNEESVEFTATDNQVRIKELTIVYTK